MIFTIWELGINRTIYVAVESASQLCYSNEPSMFLIMGGGGGVMSVFVGAYMSTWDVCPDPPAALTLRAGFELGRRGPSGLGRAEPPALTAAREGTRRLVRGRGDTSTLPCPSCVPGGAAGRCPGVGDQLPRLLCACLEMWVAFPPPWQE